MILGTAEQIQEKIDLALQLVKEEKNNDVRLALYNYIGNLYSALSTIKGRKVYPNKDKIFEQQKQYRENNKDKMRESTKRWYQANRDKKLEYNKQWNKYNIIWYII